MLSNQQNFEAPSKEDDLNCSENFEDFDSSVKTSLHPSTHTIFLALTDAFFKVSQVEYENAITRMNISNNWRARGNLLLIKKIVEATRHQEQENQPSEKKENTISIPSLKHKLSSPAKQDCYPTRSQKKLQH